MLGIILFFTLWGYVLQLYYIYKINNESNVTKKEKYKKDLKSLRDSLAERAGKKYY